MYLSSQKALYVDPATTHAHRWADTAAQVSKVSVDNKQIVAKMEELRELQNKLYTEIESVKAANKESGEYGKLILAKYSPEEWEKRFAKLASDYSNINLKLNAIISPNEDIITALSYKYELATNASRFRQDYYEYKRKLDDTMDELKIVVAYLLKDGQDLPARVNKYNQWESRYKDSPADKKKNPFEILRQQDGLDDN